MKRILLNVNDSVCTYRICNKCNSALWWHCLVKCTLCDKEVKKFSASRYNTNVQSVSTALCTEPTKWICKECDSKISGEIKCAVCNRGYSKHHTIKLTLAKYDMTDQLVRTSLSSVTSDADRICSQCDYKLRSTNVCTHCHQKFNLYRVIHFDTNNYDFEESIVSWALSQKFRHCDGSLEYICKICHSSLLSSEVKQLQMPRKAAAHRTNEPGYKYLQAKCEKPEFVCTCCHRWLFHHSVMVYDEKKYNMNNSIVRKH